MTRVQITAVLAIIAAVAATWIAHVGDQLSSQIALRSQPAPTAPQVTRTRIITSILDADPTVVGSVSKPAPAAKPAASPLGELRR